ncbi:MAG: hypothetical protein K8I03_15040 [Ignavibacteria bacterium]|nr:hypothetical protein [Ignavibacteria bacterium]
MKSLKITGILATFSVAEMKEFGKFISSPFFSRGRNVMPVFKAIKKFYPEFNDYRYENKNIFRLAYKDKKFNSTVFRRLVSDLTLLAEEYVRYLWYKSNNISCELALAKGYALKSNYKAMAAPLKKVSDLLQTEPVNQSYFEYCYQLQNMYIQYFQCKDDNYRLHIKNSFDKGEYLVLGFLSRLPQILHDIIASKVSYNIKPAESILDIFIKNFSVAGFLASLGFKKDKNHKLILLYSLLLKLFCDTGSNTENNSVYIESDYRLVFATYTEIFNELDINERYAVGDLLTTFCNLKIHEGMRNFIEYILDLYNFLIRENSLLYGGFIPYQVYIDYIMKSIMLNKTDGIENFINCYQSKLNPTVRKLAYEQSIALLLISKKDFHGSQDILKKTNPFDYKNKCEIRVLQAINYFEMGYFENLEHHIETTVKLLKKNDNITPFRREDFSPFFCYLKRLIRLRAGNTNDFEFAQTIKKINIEKQFVFKNWILEKYSENISVKQNE